MKTVLLIDDDQFVTTLYRTRLQGEGYGVEIAHSGTEALDQLNNRTPDLIVLDLNMPEMNGAEVLRQIRARPATKQTAVIIFSTGYIQSLVDEARALGVEKMLTKAQCPPNQMLAEIKAVLESLPDRESSAQPAGALECAATTAIPIDRSHPLPVDAAVDIQQAALAGLYRTIRPELDTALKEADSSRRGLLGRALKNLFEDLYTFPEHITSESAQTLQKAIENLYRIAAENQDSETALKNILKSFEE